MFREIDVETWQMYLKFRLVNNFAYQLGDDFFDARFEFYGRKLRGQQAPKERWQYALANANALLGDALGRIYLERYFPAEAKARTEEMVDNLREAFRESIDNLEWMGPETKEEAKRKLDSLRVYVGYPEYFRDYGALEISADDLLGNMMRGQRHDYSEELGKLAGPPIKGQFLIPTQSVNAYYLPTGSELVFLAGYLQPPMFNLEADDAVNYGALGSTIGHEISHAFDDQGRKVDENGELRDWWTEEDAAKYEARAEKLVEQYTAYEPLEGIHVNGRLTLGENIADLAGLTVAYRAYLRSLDGEEAPVIDGMTGAQRFFMGMAQAERSKMREEFLREILLSDPHSPSEYRVNGIVANMPEFYEAFGVSEGDGHYKAPEERVQIW